MKNALSLLLIAHNEEDNIAAMVTGMLAAYDVELLEVIVVDDYSSDRTPDIVRQLSTQNAKVRLVRKGPPCGVGRALKAGFSAVNPKARYVLSMDSDFVQNIKEVRRLITEIEKGYDGVIGSRFVDGGKLVAYPGFKRFVNRAFHVIARTLLNIKCRDLSNNFKLYKREIFTDLPYQSTDFAMNAETGILPIISGYRITEVPISWIGRSEAMGKSKFSILKFGPSYARVLLTVLKYRFTPRQ